MNIQDMFSNWFFISQRNKRFSGDLSPIIDDLIEDFIEYNNNTFQKQVGLHNCKKIDFMIHVASCINGLNLRQKERYETAYNALKSTIENAHGVMEMHVVK